MRLIDELHLNLPWYGSRQMARALRRLGSCVGRKRVRRLMRLMGLRSLAPMPSTSHRTPGHPVYPYLLRDLAVERSNQVWCADLTYLPMAHGFLYLVAIMDWYSRKVLAWRLPRTQDVTFCVEALEEAIRAAVAVAEIRMPLSQCSSRVPRGPTCLRATASRSRWTARVSGPTMSSSSGMGVLRFSIPTRAATPSEVHVGVERLGLAA